MKIFLSMNYIGISKPLIRTRVCLILGIQETPPNCPQNTKIDFLDISKETSNGTYQDHPLAIVFERRKLSISVIVFRLLFKNEQCENLQESC